LKMDLIINFTSKKNPIKAFAYTGIINGIVSSPILLYL
jgi:hypothetical protein